MWLEKIANRPLRPFVASDPVDKAVSEFLDKCVCQPQFSIVRVEDGKYRIGSDNKVLLLRILRSVCPPRPRAALTAPRASWCASVAAGTRSSTTC